ncbi:hypothetical protein Tco_0697336, partial [Tanacetum coccineum]
NTIELPEGNNVVPLGSDTIRLVQNGCSFHGLQSEDPNQHLKDFLKLVDLLDLDGENKERTRLVQIFYDRIDHTLKRTVDYAAGGRLRNISAEKAWATIEELARYEDEGWNDLVALGEGSLDYENPDIKQLLGAKECKVDTLMKNAISLMGKSESLFRLATNEMYRPPSEPSCQEEFEHIVMNFVLDQEERTRQLEDYMQAITDEFMEFSSKVTQRLKEHIKENKNKPRKIKKITRYPDTEDLEPINDHKFSETLTKEVLPSFVENTPSMTYPDEVEEIIGIPIELEPLDEIPLEDLGLNTCNHDIPLSSREIPNFDEPEPL